MFVYIVLVNGKVDCCFSTWEAAAHHATMKNKQWSRTEVVEIEVQEI